MATRMKSNMKKVTMKQVERSKEDRMIDKKKGYKEGSVADKRQDKKLQTKMSKKK